MKPLLNFDGMATATTIDPDILRAAKGPTIL
jgi:hypothetical protein